MPLLKTLARPWVEIALVYGDSTNEEVLLKNNSITSEECSE